MKTVNKLILLLLLIFSNYCFAETVESSLSTNGEITLTSNDISRGVSFSDNNPAIQGFLNLSYLQTLNVGIYATSTHFVLPSDSSKVAKQYNVYYGSFYKTFYQDWTLGFQFWKYDFLEYSELNQNELFLEIINNNFKLTIMHNPNYIGLNTKYNYLSAEYKFDLSKTVFLTSLISTTIIEKPENVDIKNYQEARLSLTKDLGNIKLNTFFSTTNRQKYYNDDKYNDTSIAFSLTVPIQF